MRVYRVEDKKGRGPYCGSGFINYYPPERHAHLQDIDVRPTPRNDGIDFNSDDYCGFSSMRKLRSWFYKKDIEWLCGEGKFRIMVYEVPRDLVKRGKKQVCFPKNHSQIRRPKKWLRN